MGLDFGLRRKRIGPGFEGCGWETIWAGRNCNQVREIVYNYLDFPIDVEHVKVGIGTVALIVKKLSSLIDPTEIAGDVTMDSLKLLDAIRGLTDVLHEYAVDHYWEEPDEYEYEFYNSY